LIFYVHSLNDVCDPYYEPHTSLNEPYYEPHISLNE